MTADRTTPDRTTGRSASPSADVGAAAAATSNPTEPLAEARGSGLTVNQVLAGAGAAATSAVAGSIFGAAGTVAGAALGSVVSTIGSTIYQRSLDRTRDVVQAKIKVVGKERSTVVVERSGSSRHRAASVVTSATSRTQVPAPRPSLEDAETVQLAAVRPPEARRRRWLLGVVLAALAFVLGLLVVTGVEWAKGSTIVGGETGTSIGRVVAPPPAPVDEPGATPGTSGEGGSPSEVGPLEDDDPTIGEPGTGEPGSGTSGSGEPGTGGSSGTGSSGSGDSGPGNPDSGDSRTPTDRAGSGAAPDGETAPDTGSGGTSG